MDGFKEFQGKDLDSAIREACAYFDARREQLEIEILQDAKSGIFGIVGARKAKIRARRVRLRETMESVLGSGFGHGEPDAPSVASAAGAPGPAGGAQSAATQAGQAAQARPSQPAGQSKPAFSASQVAPASSPSSTSSVSQGSQGQRRQEVAKGVQTVSQAPQARPEAPKADAGSPSVQPAAKGEAKPMRQSSPLQPHRPLRDGRGRQGPGRGQGRGVPEPIAMDIGSELAFHADVRAEEGAEEGPQAAVRDQCMAQGGLAGQGRVTAGSAPRETGRRPAQGRRREQDGHGRQSPFASAGIIDMRDPRLGRQPREGRGPKPVRDARDVRDVREGRERSPRRERIRPSDVPGSRPDGQPHTQFEGQPDGQLHGQVNVQAQGLAERQRPLRNVPPRHISSLAPRTAFDQAAMDDGEDLSAYKPFEEVDQEAAKQCALEVASHLVRPLLDGEPELSADIRDGRIMVAVTGVEDCGLLIGREGLTLASVQYFASRIVSKKLEASVRVQLEVGDYRQRQDEKMRELAMLLAQKVLDTGRSFSTRPLSSYHRRIVHMCLRDVEGVQTRSSGDGTMKRVVVMRKRPGAMQPLPERDDEEN